MKIFVAYGYNDRDRWIAEMVFPVIEAFGSKIETGEITYGNSISDSVKRKIFQSDALIAFTTRRETQDNKVWQTHRWVIEELAVAAARNKKRIEVLEVGVEQQGGFSQDYQRIEYDEKARDKCLVEIVKALVFWHRTESVRIQLLPENVANHDLRPLLAQGLSCEYKVRTGNLVEDPIKTEIEKISGGLFINVPRPESDAFIQIMIRHGNREWSSDYETLNSYGINLR